MSILHCTIRVNHVGVKQWVGRGLESDKATILIQDDVVVFNEFPDGAKIDMRAKAPFHSILPCPWCGTTNDRKHKSQHHLASSGFTTKEVLQTADQFQISEHKAYLRLLDSKLGF